MRSRPQPAEASTWLMRPEDAGAELFRVRPAPEPIAWLSLAGLIALGGVLGLLPPERSAWTVLSGSLTAALLFGLLFGAGFLQLHRVCVNALVLGASPFPGGTPYVIPWESVRPGSLCVHDPAVGLRGTAGPTGDRGTRMAIYSGKAVSLQGLVADLAGPRLRERSATALRLLAVRSAQELEQDPPLTRWVLGVRDPEPLTRAIEAALVARGLAEPGLADRALRDRVAGAGGPETRASEDEEPGVTSRGRTPD